MTDEEIREFKKKPPDEQKKWRKEHIIEIRFRQEIRDMIKHIDFIEKKYICSPVELAQFKRMREIYHDERKTK